MKLVADLFQARGEGHFGFPQRNAGGLREPHQRAGFSVGVLPSGQLFLNLARGIRPAEVANHLPTAAAKAQLAKGTLASLLDLHRALPLQGRKVFGRQPQPGKSAAWLGFDRLRGVRGPAGRRVGVGPRSVRY